MALNKREVKKWQDRLDAITTNVEFLEIFNPNKDYIMQHEELKDIFVKKKYLVLLDTYNRFINNKTIENE